MIEIARMEDAARVAMGCDWGDAVSTRRPHPLPATGLALAALAAAAGLLALLL